MRKRLIHWPVCFAVLVSSQASLAQDEGSSTPPPCAADDFACQIIRMSPKPGGGAGSGITNGERLEFGSEKFRVELGVERVPSEQMRLPELQQCKMDAARMQ